MRKYTTWSLKGIDVSAYNKITDFNAVKNAGVEFAIVKIIRKDLTPDKAFEYHWEGFQNAGIVIQGVYNYSYATTVAKAISDAKKVIEILNGRKTMVWLDVEADCQKNLGATLIEIIKAYASVIHDAGLEFGIYTGRSFYNSYLKPYASMFDYPMWVARYPSSEDTDFGAIPNFMNYPDIKKTTYGWQYSSKGIIKGISGHVDLDIWFVGIEASTFVPSETKPESNDYISKGFKEDLAVSLGLSKTAPASTILDKTVTISSTKNKYHASVTALERLMKTYGYYTGEIEADLGKKPNFGNGMHKATCLFQANIAGFKKPDGEWTTRNTSYKQALGLR